VSRASSGYGGVVGLIILVLIGWWMYDTHLKPSVWTAVYESPYAVRVQTGGEFKDKDSCLRWIYSARLKNDGNYSYECGKDCRPPESPYGLYVCSETVD
jgi:hypothetical protein